MGGFDNKCQCLIELLFPNIMTQEESIYMHTHVHKKTHIHTNTHINTDNRCLCICLIICMSVCVCVFSTLYSIRHLQQLKTVIFLHRNLMCTVLLKITLICEGMKWTVTFSSYKNYCKFNNWWLCQIHWCCNLSPVSRGHDVVRGQCYKIIYECS
jgi:hypothetical protein